MLDWRISRTFLSVRKGRVSQEYQRSTPSRDHTHMVVHGFKHFFGSNQQRGHFPNGHLKIHLRKFKESVQRQPRAHIETSEQPRCIGARPGQMIKQVSTNRLKKRGILMLAPRLAEAEEV